MKLNPYTVLLLYPHHHDDRPETYLGHVKAADPGVAAEHVRQLAAKANDGFIQSDDFYVLAVFPGHINRI